MNTPDHTEIEQLRAQRDRAIAAVNRLDVERDAALVDAVLRANRAEAKAERLLASIETAEGRLEAGDIAIARIYLLGALAGGTP